MADKTYKLWRSRLEKEQKAHKTFRKQADEAEKAARDEGDHKHAFNIQWANSKIVRAAIYSNTPKPDVRRRFQKANPDEKNLARLVERAIEYQVDTADFLNPSSAAVKDFVECGIGVPRVVYEPAMQDMTDEMGEPMVGEDGEPMQEIIDQAVRIEHIPWRHFHWEPGKSWENVDWVAFQSFLPRKEVERDYGVKIQSGKDEDASKRQAEEYTDEVQIFEIWCKSKRKVYVLASSHPELLEERDDTLNLQGFFPIPRPLFANLKSDELIPKPDYEFVKPQIIELNRITQRIKSLVAQIKAVGYYDSANRELGDLMASADGTYKPVDGLGTKSEYKPSEAMVHVPMMEKIQVVRELQMQREETKNQIYEIIGISDIIRGSSKASETAAAQNLKGQWANVRLSEKSSDVARIWRDVYRIYAEIICEHFDPRILMLQTGIEITPQMYQMMKSDIGRSFAIDIETDSTIAKDDFEERQQTMELVETILAKLEQVIPAVAQGMLPVEFVQETLMFVVSKHKNGKQIEDAVQALGPHLQGLQQFQQQMQQMQQQMQQQQMQLEQAGQAVQQRDKALQDMQKQLGQFNEREEMRKDAELKIKDRESQAAFRRNFVETEAQQIENLIVRQKHKLDSQETVADIGKKRAETAKTVKETALMGMV